MLIETLYGECLRTRFPLPSNEDLDAFEAKHSFKMPESYREFLLGFNGGSFRHVVVAFGNEQSDFLTYMHGIGATFESAELGEDFDLFEDNSPLALFPIGGTGFGTLILMDLEGSVLCQEAYTDSFELLADSLEEFLQSLELKVT